MVVYTIILLIFSSYFIYKFLKGFVKPKFTGKTVWITGASSGIGECLAHQFSNSGAHIILSARNQDQLTRVKNAIQANNGTAQIFPIDLFDPQIAFQIAKDFCSKTKIDILVNNAGSSQRTTYSQTCDSILVQKRLMNLNYLSPVALTKAVSKQMIQRKSGHLVAVSSISGLLGTALRGAYVGSKFAITGFQESIRGELSHHGIRVTTVYPSYVKTNIGKNALAADGQRFGKNDENIMQGMDPNKVAKRIVKGVYNGESNILINPLSHKVVLWAKFVWPSLYDWIMKKFALKQLRVLNQTRAGN